MPKILLATTCHWFATARLGLALMDAGCSTEAVCPSGHPLTETTGGLRTYRYSPTRPLASILSALNSARPDLIIPCDDHATVHLHRLHDRAGERAGGATLRELIERSLGPSSSFPITAAKSQLLALAQERGVRTPATKVVSTQKELKDWLDVNGFPAVLKADGSFGGGGVRVVTGIDAARRAFGDLASPPSMLRMVKRTLVDRDVALVRPCILKTRGVVSAQRFIQGQDANIAVACWRGRTLATIGVKVLRTRVARGPSSLIQTIDNHEMFESAALLVRALGLTGLVGFDFVLDADTDLPHLIEMNARATQTCHLRLGAGKDLPGALSAALSGKPALGNSCSTTNDVIALFPQELQRDPRGSMLAMVYHDVPWDQLRLVQAGLRETLEVRRRIAPDESSEPATRVDTLSAVALRPSLHPFTPQRSPRLRDAGSIMELRSTTIEPHRKNR